MYTVMIVDDEVTIREKLPQLVDFNRYGFSVCTSAKNGAEALELIPQCKPDLILLDVRMPVMDGLSLLRHLRNTEYRDIFVIILSGYSDFEYAKKAMDYGVKTYLTKPVDEDEAARHLEEIRQILDKRSFEKKRSRYHRDLMALREADNKKENARLEDLYFILHIIPKSLKSNYKNMRPFQLITKAMSERIGMEEGGLCVKTGCVYSFLVPIELADVTQSGLYHFAAGLNEKFKGSGLECAFLFDTEALTEEKELCYMVYERHLKALLRENFYTGNTYLLHSTLPKEPEKPLPDYLDEIYESLRSGIEALEDDAVKETMERLYGIVYRERLGLDELENISDRIYYLLTDLITTPRNKQAQKPMIPKIVWLDNPVFYGFEKWKELHDRQVNAVLAFSHQNSKMQYTGMSGDLLEYVYDNYRSPISIKQVAEHFHMNPAYLGRLFQRATGVSFKRYVNRLRIAEAKHLLQNTDKLIYKIAEEVGFSDSSYFIAKFIKEEGISPMEYRKHE